MTQKHICTLTAIRTRIDLIQAKQSKDGTNCPFCNSCTFYSQSKEVCYLMLVFVTGYRVTKLKFGLKILYLSQKVD